VKKFLSVFAFLLLLLLPALLTPRVRATSQQAYSDYLYQFDQYRQKYNDFVVAKNTYQKFNTLDAQSTALSTAKTMLSQRDLLLHAYLSFLYERVGEQAGITPTNRQLYQSLLTTELAFLENQSSLVSSINTTDDATTISQQLEDHYQVLSATMDQIIAGLSFGQLNVIAQNFQLQLTNAQQLVQFNSATITQAKQTTINNWITQITSKQNLYQQKIASINAASAAMANSIDPNDLSSKFLNVQSQLNDAKGYLSDSIANLGEIVNALQYQN